MQCQRFVLVDHNVMGGFCLILNSTYSILLKMYIVVHINDAYQSIYVSNILISIKSDFEPVKDFFFIDGNITEFFCVSL